MLDVVWNEMDITQKTEMIRAMGHAVFVAFTQRMQQLCKENMVQLNPREGNQFVIDYSSLQSQLGFWAELETFVKTKQEEIEHVLAASQ